MNLSTLYPLSYAARLGLATAWVNFSGNTFSNAPGAPFLEVRSSYNISSVTKMTTGYYSIQLNTGAGYWVAIVTGKNGVPRVSNPVNNSYNAARIEIYAGVNADLSDIYVVIYSLYPPT